MTRSARDTVHDSASAPVTLDAARLAAVISPLRRALLSATRASAELPELPEAQIDVLRTLPRGTAKGPAEIAAQLRLGRPTISNLLGAMESDGLVERGADPVDGRRVLVTASPRALDLFERFDSSSSRLVAEAVSRLGDAERSALSEALPALERLCAVLTGADDSASTPTSTETP
ncbi:DNA-binding MarR family transcriptional regulator [Microbacterium natoriense]|uniref:DNA-binding MarR family transcriptional regulator n=1 Tax=Microbacterium natoriense TaxID=284570 RepID=A0AAW8F3Y5_9MICO|nr:MarR family winged helix-turn-helix transcriptional regulator [Microbacterium natoriense]MDQ0649589.1 DNA-binding MarR family transcriptional regulator [Microbacterium natoriense]